MQLGANNRNLEFKIKCWVSEICKLHAVKEKNSSCFGGSEHTNIAIVQIVDGGLHIKLAFVLNLIITTFNADVLPLERLLLEL